MTLSSPYQFSNNWKNYPKISMYRITLMVGIMIPGHLNDVQTHIINDLGNLFVFFRHSFLCFLWMSMHKISSSIILVNANPCFITEYHFHPIIYVTLFETDKLTWIIRFLASMNNILINYHVLRRLKFLKWTRKPSENSTNLYDRWNANNWLITFTMSAIHGTRCGENQIRFKITIQR